MIAARESPRAPSHRRRYRHEFRPRTATRHGVRTTPLRHMNVPEMSFGLRLRLHPRRDRQARQGRRDPADRDMLERRPANFGRPGQACPSARHVREPKSSDGRGSRTTRSQGRDARQHHKLHRASASPRLRHTRPVEAMSWARASWYEGRPHHQVDNPITLRQARQQLWRFMAHGDEFVRQCKTGSRAAVRLKPDALASKWPGQPRKVCGRAPETSYSGDYRHPEGDKS